MRVTHSRTIRVLTLAALAAAGLVRTPAQSAPSFTVAQAANGRRAYMQHCQSCHGITLADGPLGPGLKGAEFRQNWFGRTADMLFTATAAMPPAAPSSLGDAAYADIVAFLLAENGLPPGDVVLPADRAALSGTFLPWLPPSVGAELPGGLKLPPPPARANPFDHMTPVTDAMLADPPAGAWLTWRRTWDSQGFSPLNQITRSNVGSLRVKWTWSLPDGPNEGTPLFHDGVLYVHAYGDRIQAFDAVSGDLLWNYSRPPARTAGPTVKRTIAIYEDRIYFVTSDTHIVALAAKTGRPIWDHPVSESPREARYFVTSGPLVAKGKVMVGVSGSAPGGNFIVAVSAETGQEAWRFHTIARPDAHGGNSWNGLPLEKRNGASVWVAGSYDPSLNLAFFGTAQTYDTGPLRDRSSDPAVTNDALYTDSTIAINPDTGALVWYFQHQPNDQWDLDWALEQVLFKLPGQQKTLLATAGKQAIYDVLEADTGKYVFSMDLGLQDVVVAIDPKTGAKQIDPKKVPRGEIVSVCPHSGGAKSWTPESYNPNTRTLFVPLNESCMDLVPVPAGGRTMLSSGVRWRLRPRPDSDGKYGRLQAINLETRTVVWTMRQRAPLVSGALATAGGVVFAGGLDRVFAAYDDANGRELWRVRLNDVPNGAPISFIAGGRQYIAITVGNGGPLTKSFGMLVPEIKNPAEPSPAVYVFELAAR